MSCTEGSSLPARPSASGYTGIIAGNLPRCLEAAALRVTTSPRLQEHAGPDHAPRPFAHTTVCIQTQPGPALIWSRVTYMVMRSWLDCRHMGLLAILGVQDLSRFENPEERLPWRPVPVRAAC